MALVTVQNLTNSILSTDVGSLLPAQTKSLTMGPDQAYRASEGLRAMQLAGKVLVTISEEVAKLDALEPAAVGTASVADLAVTTAKLAAGAVTAAKLGAGAVDAAALGAAAVQATKLAFFKSTEQTGTGSSQNIAHGLATTPGLVMIIPSAVASATDTFVEGAHGTTNVVVTASTGAKFKVVAIK